MIIKYTQLFELKRTLSQSAELLSAPRRKLKWIPDGDELSIGSSAADPCGASYTPPGTRGTRETRETRSFSSAQTQLLTDAETLGNSRQILRRLTAAGTRCRIRLILRWVPRLSRGFSPLIPLHTTSKRFALWNDLCDIWANRRTACEIFNHAANKEAW